MCGIIGYVGGRNALPILINGLKRLEYRGYDSAGVTLRDGSLKMVRCVGEINVLEKKLLDKNLSGTIGIGHTRWATHGGVKEKNAHPHCSNKKDFAIVHNGIIENFMELKQVLQDDGFVFSSETDSEVIVHLISKHYTGDFESAVSKAVSLLEGTYGVVAISQYEDKLVAARNGSPLVLGIGKGEYFIASDVSAIIEHTKKVVFLKDKDFLSVSRSGYKIENIDEELPDRAVEIVNTRLEALEKKGYKHFMLKEIFEQPDSINNVLRGRISGVKVHLGGLNLQDGYIKNLKRIIFVACGTSWHAGLVGEYLFESILKIPVEVEYASEFRYRNPVIDKDDLVIVISQSGETADTLAALREAKRLGAKTLGIVNVVGSTISREVGGGIYLHAGPEIGVASTKAFTSQVMALHLLALHIAQIRKNSFNPKKLIDEMQSIPRKISDTLKLSGRIRAIARRYVKNKNFLYLGRGINFPVALEGALKLKEISYIHAEGYPAAEMKHGPIALIDKDMPVVFLANKSIETYDKIVSNLEEAKTRNARIIAVATEEDGKIKKLANHTIFVPKAIESLTTIINCIPLQLLAYHVADLKGFNVDKPRNLAKSVTVE